MIGRVLSVGVPKADKKGEIYRSVLLEARMPCYDKGLELKEGEKYNFVLLGKHDFVQITEAKKLEVV